MNTRKLTMAGVRRLVQSSPTGSSASELSAAEPCKEVTSRLMFMAEGLSGKSGGDVDDSVWPLLQPELLDRGLSSDLSSGKPMSQSASGWKSCGSGLRVRAKVVGLEGGDMEALARFPASLRADRAFSCTTELPANWQWCAAHTWIRRSEAALSGASDWGSDCIEMHSSRT